MLTRVCTGESEEAGQDGGEEGGDDEEEEDEEEEEEEEDEPEDPKPKIEEDCLKTKECAPLKHHYDECAERVKHQEETHGKANEDCVEECEYISNTAAGHTPASAQLKYQSKANGRCRLPYDALRRTMRGAQAFPTAKVNDNERPPLSSGAHHAMGGPSHGLGHALWSGACFEAIEPQSACIAVSIYIVLSSIALKVIPEYSRPFQSDLVAYLDPFSTIHCSHTPVG